MYTKQDLKEQLKEMGLKHGDVLMMHSSMKAIGDVCGGADTVIDAMMEYFCDGMFMTPTHTWAQMGKDYRVFNPQTERSCVGIIPDLFMKREGVVRSLHPTHSIAVYGKGSAEYIKNEENCITPCAPEGCWGRLRNVHAKILLAGVTHARNTYIHSVEESYNVPERFTKEREQFEICMPDKSRKEVAVYRHYNPYEPHISENYDKLTEAFFETGAAVRTRLGDAECILCDTEKIFKVTGHILEKEINCLIDRECIPREWWSDII